MPSPPPAALPDPSADLRSHADGGEGVPADATSGATEAQLIAEIVRQLNQSLEFERVVGLVARHAVELLGAVRSSVLTIDGDELVVAASCGPGVYQPGTRIPLASTFGGAAIRAGRVIRSADVRAERARWPYSAAAMPDDGIPPNAIAAPLLIGGRAIGTVCAWGRAEPGFGAAEERLLATLADHAAVAAENARLFSAAARTARHASILAASARELALHVTPRALYDGLTRVATNMLGASGVCVFLADPETRHVEVAHSTMSDATALADVVRGFWDGALGAVVLSGQPAFHADATAWLSCAPEAGSPAAALLPLVVEGRPRGALVLHFTQPQRFDPPNRRLLGDFGTQLAVALRNAALVEALERRAARLAAVAQVQQALPRAEVQDVYAELHRAVGSVVDAPCVALLVLDPESGALVPQYVVVDGQRLPATSLGPCPARDAVAAEALRTGEPVLEQPPTWSLSAAAPLEPGRERPAAQASLAAPVLHGHRALGVLHVQSYQPGAYSAEDADLVAIVARQAGAALELARLFDAQRRERELAEVGAEVARLALGAAGVRETAAAMLAVVSRLAPGADLLLGARVDGGATMEYLAATPGVQELIGLRVPFADSIARHLTPGELTHLPDVRTATHAGHRQLAPAREVVLVPLEARGRTIGVLAVGVPIGTTHPPGTLEALRRVAAPVALAVEALLLGVDEQQRVARERTLAAALATMDQPVLVLDAEERVRYANPAAVREYGYAPEELSGLPLDRLVAAVQSASPAAATWVGTAPAVSASEAPHLAQEVHRRRDGSEFPAAVTVGTIRDEDGTPTGRVLSVRNLTDERRVAEQLRQQEKLAALGSLVAGVAHELNNPLTGISAFSQLLLEDPLAAEQLESVRLIKREADRAVGVIRDLLLFSRKSEAQLAPVDVNALLRLTVRLRTYTLRAEDITVDLALDPTLPPVLGDEQRLQQVLLNLIVNAEYALSGRPERRLTLRTRRAGAHLVIEVSDTGRGIDAETQRHIFEPFFTTKPAGVGTGLGLSVSYGIVQAHGGTITVDSGPGRGATFRITLPLRAAVLTSESA